MQGDLDSFLIEISSLILPKKDDKGDGFLVDKILDKTGMKGTGGSQACRKRVRLCVLTCQLCLCYCGVALRVLCNVWL